MTLLEWLRETSRRQVPDWMRYSGVALVFVILFVFRSVLGMTWIETIVLGGIVGAGAAALAKVIWAKAVPLSEADTLGHRLDD